jgi:hypothetical protein
MIISPASKLPGSRNTVRTGDIFNNDRLLPTTGELFGNEPRGDIDSAAGWKRHNHSNGAQGPVLRQGRRGQKGHGSQPTAKRDYPAIQLMHGILHRYNLFRQHTMLGFLGTCL